MSRIIWGAPDWILPTVAIAAVLLAVVVRSYWQAPTRRGVRILAASLKLAAILALSLCLLDPLVSGTRPRPKANVFALVIDNSESMQIGKRGLPSTDELKRWLGPEGPRWRTRLEQDFDLRTYAFDRQLRRLEPGESLDFNGTSTQLGAALASLRDRFQRRPIAGAVLISDGNATEANAIDIGQLGFPIFPVIDSKAAEARDIRIGQVRINQTNFETSPTTISATLLAESVGRTAVTVELVDPQGEIVEEQALDIDPGRNDNSVRFRFRPEFPGLSFYQLNVFPKGDRQRFEKGESKIEATLANNSRAVMIDRGGGPYRILYVGGRPNWEFKFLRRALQEDDEIQLVGLLRIANKEPKFAFRDQQGVGKSNRLFEGFDNRDPDDAENYDQPVLVRFGVEDESELRDGFPKSAEELFAYHALILDDLEASFFSPDQMLLIRRYIGQRGAGLLMLGGPSSFHLGQYERTPLDELLPVYLAPDQDRPQGAVSLNLTREGWLDPWVRLRATELEERKRLDAMPSFLTLNPSGNAKPGASVVARAEGGDGKSTPAIVTQRFGTGRTAAALIGDFWRWSLRRKAAEPDDLAVFWRQTMRWLTADVPRRVELQVEPAGDEETVSIQLTVRDEEFEAYDGAKVSLSISGPSQETFEVEAEADSTKPGTYIARYWPDKPGGYRVTATVDAADGSFIAKRESGWTSQPAVREFARIQPDRTQLNLIAAASGGHLIGPSQLDDFVSGLLQRKVPVTEPWVYPLWHQPFVFGFAILCLCGEWGLRRWKGLV